MHVDWNTTYSNLKFLFISTSTLRQWGRLVDRKKQQIDVYQITKHSRAFICVQCIDCSILGYSKVKRSMGFHGTSSSECGQIMRDKYVMQGGSPLCHPSDDKIRRKNKSGMPGTLLAWRQLSHHLSSRSERRKQLLAPFQIFVAYALWLLFLFSLKIEIFCFKIAIIQVIQVFHPLC